MATSHDQIVYDKPFVMNKKHKSIFIMMIAHMQPLISMMCGADIWEHGEKGQTMLQNVGAHIPSFEMVLLLAVCRFGCALQQ